MNLNRTGFVRDSPLLDASIETTGMDGDGMNGNAINYWKKALGQWLPLAVVLGGCGVEPKDPYTEIIVIDWNWVVDDQAVIGVSFAPTYTNNTCPNWRDSEAECISNPGSLEYVEDVWLNGKVLQLVENAEKHEQRLTLFMAPQWAEYLQASDCPAPGGKPWMNIQYGGSVGSCTELIDKMVETGHEIGLLRHAVTDPQWDGYTNISPEESESPVVWDEALRARWVGDIDAAMAHFSALGHLPQAVHWVEPEGAVSTQGRDWHASFHSSWRQHVSGWYSEEETGDLVFQSGALFEPGCETIDGGATAQDAHAANKSSFLHLKSPANVSEVTNILQRPDFEVPDPTNAMTERITYEDVYGRDLSSYVLAVHLTAEANGENHMFYNNAFKHLGTFLVRSSPATEILDTFPSSPCE
jgi:hypothetical protein